jgi:hypothetical protein
VAAKTPFDMRRRYYILIQGNGPTALEAIGPHRLTLPGSEPAHPRVGVDHRDDQVKDGKCEV